MKVISRKLAMQVISIHTVAKMTRAEKTDYLFDAGVLAKNEAYDLSFEKDLVHELIEDLFGVTNEWLLLNLKKENILATIKSGEYEFRHKCLCCNYLSLLTKDDFEICEICYWEDDPLTKEVNKISSINHGLTLEDAKKNFVKFGAVEQKYIDQVKPKIKYPIASILNAKL